MVKTATSPSVAIYMPMARELLPGIGEQTLKDEVKKMGGALNKPVLFLSNTSEETKITRSNGKMKKATILIHREQLPEDVLSQLDCSKMLQCACNWQKSFDLVLSFSIHSLPPQSRRYYYNCATCQCPTSTSTSTKILATACCSWSDYRQQHFGWFCNSLKCGRSVILKLVDAYSRHGLYHACKHAHGIIFHSHSQTSHSRRERTSLHQLQQVSWNDGHVWDSMIQHKMFPLFMQIPQLRQKGASLWFQWTKIPVRW